MDSSLVTTATDGEAAWWNHRWRFRTTVIRSTPYRDGIPRPIEVAIDFPLLLAQAGVGGEFDPDSVRVVDRSGKQGAEREVPFAYRTEFDARAGHRRPYLSWMARPERHRVGTYDIYFDTRERGIGTRRVDADQLPPENLVANAGFEEEQGGLPDGWTVNAPDLVALGRFEHTTGRQSVKIAVDEGTPEGAERTVVLSQTIDVRAYAGQEMVFECDLLAERAKYGAPVSIELQQFRADGSRILEYAVQPRWLSIELAEGQFVSFSERGRFSHGAASVNVNLSVRCIVKDADTWETVAGPESFFTVWLDRIVVRPGERWPWPARSCAGFVSGALEDAPLNRGFEFTGQRRLVFNGASEGTLTRNDFDEKHPESVHWGLEAGTLEFWCRPSWDANDGAEHVFFHGAAYGHRLQSFLRKLGAEGNNELAFTVADAGCTERTVQAPARLCADQWHHIAATWDFSRAHLQLFVDGKCLAAEGPGADAWRSSTVHGDGSMPGIGISEEDSRSMPMQAFIGGDRHCDEAEGRAADAVLDELRISDRVRYQTDFVPSKEEFEVDDQTRALFHFENEHHGVHDSDDRFVRGYLSCELPPREAEADLEMLDNGRVERRKVRVEPRAPAERFEANRVENRLTVTRPFCELPDPRFVDCRERRVERTVGGADEAFVLEVGGDFEPLMRWVTFERVEGSEARTTWVPHWRANDRVVPFSVESLATTLAPDAADEAERALEAFRYALEVTNYFDAHFCETLPTRHRMRVGYTLLKALNIYPFDQCGPLNHMLRKLLLTVGISSNNASGTHHQFQQAFYGGSWRLFDLSPRLFWLDRDNRSVVSWRGFEEDLYLKLRQGTEVRSGLPGRRSQATFGTAERPHNMDFPLRPGERASLCWQNEGRWLEVRDGRKPIHLAKIPPYFGNGALVYEPAAGEATEVDNLVVETANGSSVLRARDPARPAVLIYRPTCPYIFSDGRVKGAYRAREADAIRISLSFDEGRSWTEVWRNPEGRGEMHVGLLEQVIGYYAYRLKVELAAGQEASVDGLEVRTTFVASPLALPGKFSLGENRIRFLGGQPAVSVKTRCCWVERFRSELGVSLNGIGYYMNGDEAHRNLFVAAPGREREVVVSLYGRPLQGCVSLQGLPEGWARDAERRSVEVDDPAQPADVTFTLLPGDATQGEICAFDVVVQEGDAERRVPAQVLITDAPLVCEAEGADEMTGEVSAVDLPEASGARALAFTGSGQVGFDFTAFGDGRYALWLRARWEEESGTRMGLTLDGQEQELEATAMIGFKEWEDPTRAHGKTFAFFGDRCGYWGWYRVPDVEVAAGEHRLSLAAGPGAWFDTVLLLPQNPVMDRAAMNLFQNWNYAPWDNPF